MDSGDYTYAPVKVVDRIALLEEQVKELQAWQAQVLTTQSLSSGISPLTETCANGAPATSLEVAHTLKTLATSPNGSKESDTIASVAIGKSQRQQQRQRQTSKGNNLALNLRIYSQEMWRLGFPSSRTWDAERMLTMPTSSQAALRVGLSWADLQRYAYRLIPYSDIWYAKKRGNVTCECGAAPQFYAGFKNITSGGSAGFGGLWVCEDCADVMDNTDTLTILVEMQTVLRYANRGKLLAGRDSADVEDEEG